MKYLFLYPVNANVFYNAVMLGKVYTKEYIGMGVWVVETACLNHLLIREV